MFLTHLRELSWIHLPSGKVGTARRLTEGKTGKTIPLAAVGQGTQHQENGTAGPGCGIGLD